MFSGSIVALVTPFNEDFTLAWQALHDLVEWHIEAGTSALVINGTTAEAATLTENEKALILQRVIKQANGRIKVIAGTGHASTAITITQSQQAQELGADACLIVTPYYNRPNQEGLYQHYSAIAEQVSLPIITYNVPKRTGCDLLPETLARLAEMPNIIGIKDATGDLTRLKAYQALAPNRFIYLSGDDNSAMEFMNNGGHGVISVASNVAPIAMQTLCTLTRNKILPQAYELNSQLQELYTGLQADTNPITVKWLLAQMGKINNVLRLPLTPLAQPYHSLLAPLLAKIRMLELQYAKQDNAQKENTYA